MRQLRLRQSGFCDVAVSSRGVALHGYSTPDVTLSNNVADAVMKRDPAVTHYLRFLACDEHNRKTTLSHVYRDYPHFPSPSCIFSVFVHLTVVRFGAFRVIAAARLVPRIQTVGASEGTALDHGSAECTPSTSTRGAKKKHF